MTLSIDSYNKIPSYGDGLFGGYYWAMDNVTLMSSYWEPVNKIGDKKYIPLSELTNPHAEKVRLNKEYFANNPPTVELDREDPNKDMTRIYHPIAKQVIKKAALFLFGKQKFKGIDSFKFSSPAFEKEFTRVWKDNKFDSKVIDLGQTYFRDGDAIYKVVSKKIGTEIVSTTVEDGKEVVKEQEVAQIYFLKTATEHWTTIVNRDDPSQHICWIYQFEREDGTYVREEYFIDKMLKFEGKISVEKKFTDYMKSIVNTALFRNMPTEAMIEYTLVDSQDYASFGRFPLLRFKNNEECSLWGPSLLDGNYGEIDRLNEILTRMAYAIKMQADPLLWVAGAESADQNTHASDAVWSFSSPDAKLNVLQWEGTPESVFTFVNMIESKIYDCAFIPRSSDVEKIFSNDNRMSGAGLQELKSDIIDATLARRADFERGFEDMLDIIARLTGIEIPKDDSAVDMVWGPVFALGAADRRDALLEYLKNDVISREQVIDLSDDFTPQVKEQMKSELAKIDNDKIQKEAKLKQLSQPAMSPAPRPSAPSDNAPRRRPRRRG